MENPRTVTTTPADGYMVCASSRSGSTLLCDLLAQTRVAGDPQSYFRPATVTDLANEWGVEVSDGPWVAPTSTLCANAARRAQSASE